MRFILALIISLLLTTSVYSQKKEEILSYAPEMPQFAGGDSVLLAYISQHVNYPTDAVLQNIEGKAYIKFTVNKKGEVKNPTILKSAHPLLDSEAIHMVRYMPNWIPGKKDGKTVNVFVTLPVAFKLKEPIKKEMILSLTALEERNEKEEKSALFYADKMPEFSGDYNNFIQQNLHYPPAARDKGIQGRVTTQFVVSETGEIDSIIVKSAPDPSLAAEVVRIIKLMPNNLFNGYRYSKCYETKIKP